MKRLKNISYITICSFVCYLFVFQSVTYAQARMGRAADCTDVHINYSDDPTLTREERVRLMDKALIESLNKFELCQSAKKMAETNGAASASGGGATGGAGESSNKSGEAGESDESDEMAGAPTNSSAASSTMSGTASPNETSVDEDAETGVSDTGLTAQGKGEVNGTNSGNIPLGNGRRPEDIPLANNDSALAAQIRYAAENETDPVKREQLWNEYRKYKGLAPKK